MNPFHPESYGPRFAPLLDTERRRALGVGVADEAAKPLLDALTVESAFAHVVSKFGPSQPANRDMAECCLAGAWLLHDFLDVSHKISQSIDTPSGSFWHAIMHRREGDFSNAKYWFRRAGRHPVYDALGQRAGELAAERGESHAASRLLADGGSWDPAAFVDLVESSEQGARPEIRELCLTVQQTEWELLFDYCYQNAVSKQ